MKKLTILYDKTLAEVVKEKIVPYFGLQSTKIIAYAEAYTIVPEEDEIVVTYLPDNLLKEFLPIAVENNWKMAFLPHPRMIHGKQCFGISHTLEAAMETIRQGTPDHKADLLLVNGIPVLDTLVIGDSLSVMYGSTEHTPLKKAWGKLKSFLNLFRSVRLHQYILASKLDKDEKKETINTAALGMLVVQHGRSSLLSRRILEDSYANDGMMHILILAPESIFGLLKFGIMSLFRTRHNPKLPPFAGYIKTNSLVVTSPNTCELSLDSTLLSAKEVVLEVKPKVMQIVPGPHLEFNTHEKTGEIFKTHVLPRGELRDELLKGPIPLIHHATADQFKELFTTLRENARPTSSYLVLMFLSTFIATLGLFSNSSPVIIGAMILAPLMAPIISLSMGVLRQDHQLIRSSLTSIGLGMLFGYLCAILITWFLPLSAANTQILIRTRPNLLDLGIAIGSGIAGAYAHAKKEIAKTLAGVAIAVALIPPLAVSGIGAARLNWEVFSGALLLLTTNLAGMILAAAMTFLLLGFSPFRLAKKGLIISLVFVLGISAPLAYGFTRMVRETTIVQRLDGVVIDGITLRNVEVRGVDPLVLSLVMITNKELDEDQLAVVKENIEELMGEEVALEFTIGRIMK